MSNQFKTQIRDFIAPRFLGADFDDAEDIFASGFVNSLFAMELVLFLEQLTGRQIPGEQMRLDNFRSVDAMVGLAVAITGNRADLVDEYS